MDLVMGYMKPSDKISVKSLFCEDYCTTYPILQRSQKKFLSDEDSPQSGSFCSSLWNMHFKAESKKDGKVAQPTKGDITWHERSTFYRGNKRDFKDLEGIVEHETLTWETETFKQQYLPRLLEKMSLTIIPQVSLPGVHRFPGQDLAQLCQVGKGARQGGKGARQGGKGVCKVRHKSFW